MTLRIISALKLNFLLKFVLKFYSVKAKHYVFQSAQNLYGKREGSGSGDPDPGGPKKCGSCGDPQHWYKKMY